MRNRLAAAALFVSLSAFGQQQFPTLEKGFQAEKLYQFSDVDSVNVFSGTLLINLPIGPQYALDGGMSYGLRLSYNSKPWDLIDAGNVVRATPSARASAGMGWVIGYGRFVPHDDPANQSYVDLYEAPDGGDHRFNGTGSLLTGDDSNLRLRKPSTTVTEIDFPDGSTKKFEKNAAGRWELREIRNAKNSDIVTITPFAGSPASCSASTDRYWAISDSRGRTQTVCFSDLLVNSVARPMVDRVVFTSPGGSATYDFTYKAMTLAKPPSDTDHNSSNWRQTHDVQLLDTLTLPDGSTYRFEVGGGDILGTMTLPTLGKIEYQYGGWLVPSPNVCDNIYGVGYGFGASGHGVETRKFTPAVPAGQTAVSRTWLYERELRPQGGGRGYLGGPCPFEGESIHVEMFDELVVTVTDPLGHKTANHFSIWPGFLDDDSPAGFKPAHYTYPYGRPDATQNRHLSQEFFDCTADCVLKRSVWVRHEARSALHGDSRLVSQRTVFHDDPADCTAEGTNVNCARTSTDYEDWDGYGHFRKTETTIQFYDDDDVRTVTTAWNKVNGTPRTILAADRWILNTFESVTTVENGVTAVEQYCFDLTDGFLRGKRTLRGVSPAARDLLVLYGNENHDGNTSSESFFGGDVAQLAANQSVLCDALDALVTTAPEYRIAHEWQNGHVARSSYDGVSFFLRDLTVDLDGLVTASRDANGLETTYGYDSKWRLKSVTPPGQAATIYTYTNAAATGTTLTQPATVLESTVSATAGTVKREYQYDAFGRLWRQKQWMPGDVWSMRETRYDKLGRRESSSEAVSLGGVTTEFTVVPPFKTTFLYDYTGRPTEVRLPDDTVTSMSYQGARATTRTFTIAAGDPSETTVQNREEYDPQGRLVAVTENVGLASEMTTQYTYDIGGRLATVLMPGAGGNQSRSFSYDMRGLLLNERHPEVGVNGNGLTTYSLHDARGHAGRKTIGSSIDVRYKYDSAERLIRVRDAEADNRDLLLFSWDCIRPDVTTPCTSETHPGQLAATARYNYDPELGPIAVTQANHYDPATGRLIRRDHHVGNGIVDGITRFTGESFFFTQEYNDLGQIDTLSYPCRFDCTSDPARTIEHGYANGQLQSVDGWASSITYRPNGTIDTVTHGSGSTATLEKWAADPHGMPRPRRIDATKGSGSQTLWSSGDYEFDGAGNIKTIGNTAYAYDPFGRLTAWTTKSGQTTTTVQRTLDAFGNELTSSSQVCGPAGALLQCSGGASAPPRVVTGTTNRYADTTYDAAGNVLTDVLGRAYTWDPLAMMTGATVDGRTFRYLYSADNERIAAVERVLVGTTSRNRTTFTLRNAANQLLSTWTDDWTSGTRQFTRKEDTIWRGAHLLGLAADATTMRYALDHLGSPRLITNSSGTVIDQQNFEPFGYGGLFGSGALQFTAHERDQANLGNGTAALPDYMHARYYDQHGGRFLSVDPSMDLKANLPNPQRWNRYSYVSNNPINKTDPDGRDEYDMMQRQLGIQDDWDGRDKYHAAGLAAAAVVVAAVAVAPEIIAAAPYVMPLAIRAQPVLNALRNLGAAETGQATPIGRNSVIQGYTVSNHAWRKSGLGRGATEEMVAGVISGAKAAGTVTEAASTHSKHAGNTITTYVHNGVKVVVDDTRRVIMSIRPVDSKNFKVEALPNKQQ